MNFNLSPKIIFKALSLFTLFLLLINLIGVVAQSLPGHGAFYGLIRVFDFNTESNLPTLYSSINLMLSALLLLCIAIKHRDARSPWIPWVGLAAIFSFLSVDETASFHEQLAQPVQDFFNISGVLYYVWVIPYLVFLGLFTLLYARFFLRLPKKTLGLFIVSGVVFLAGAVGFEFIGNTVVQVVSDTSLLYRLFYSGEEFLEMFGVVVFIYALFDYMVRQFGAFGIAVGTPRLSR